MMHGTMSLKFMSCITISISFFFYVYMSVHRKYISELQPKRCKVFSIYLFL